ncbi:bifunctional helix-turn-helix transcriptional regulator/GNAT family N-acetyltransferase [Actinoplanes sp. NPDC026619]|uniref:bifunctional helix-turn-helix transcriptional regulator/GNAT family N-acetyltransferase n=1 Tax=Actinoplanes sp. NPDC026619 TaxID=3155798 RepID=UPI0033D6023F
MDQIELVRDFNRFYTRRLGVLTDQYLGLDRPWSESRLLFEIGAGAGVRDLRERLGLDSGYLSRMLRSLQEQGLVSVRPHPGDGRVRVAELTAAGERARADLDARARESVGEMLGQLTASQRDRLVEAQLQVRRLLWMAGVMVEAVPDDAPVARECLRRYAAELAGRFPEGYDESALIRPGELVVTGGEFVVAFEGAPGDPGRSAVGCGAWQPLSSSGLAEIRHLWIGPECRGLGLGRRVLSRLEQGAAGQGIHTLRLGTHSSLSEAAALYRSSGYREIPPYSDSIYNQLTFEKPV